MKVTLRDLQKVPHSEFHNEAFLRGRTITGVSSDSRSVRAGDLFVALRGERFDGHAFVADAFASGALGAVVAAGVDLSAFAGKPILVVEDTMRALGQLARLYREKFLIPVLAIGGSNGKTTAKEMIAAVLSTKYTVLSTQGNLNNHVGVPQTLFRLSPRHEIAVVELGTNHPGEIAALCQIARPTHGLLTNIGREHLEFFGSLDGVAEEEGELFRALSAAKRTTAFVNEDDERVASAATGIRTKVTYGFRARRAALRGRRIVLDKGGCASFEFRRTGMPSWHAVHLGVPGAHNAANALAAAAVGLAFRVAPTRVSAALASFRAVSKRMETMTIGGVLVLNDTYNANPDSMIAALRTLAACESTGKKIAVLADMKELGAHADEAHQAVGAEAASLGLDFLLTYGPLAKKIHDAAHIAGALHYEQKNVLAEYLAELLTPGDTLLIKGSRGMQMEDIISFLQQRLQTAGGV